MKTLLLAAVLIAGGLATAAVSAPEAAAQTCQDQHRACRARGHSEAECRASTNRCLKTGRWIGPAGREFPISKKK